MKARRHKSTKARSGFTLIELLVVIGIIVLVVGILIPVVGKVQENAQVAEQKAQINRIANAAEQYNLVHHAYPGPFSNADLYGVRSIDPNDPDKIILNGTGQAITDSENLLLGLLGGLKYDPALSAVKYDDSITRSQLGPYKLNPGATRGPSESFLKLRPEEFSGVESSVVYGSVALEIIDRFGTNTPLLYYRASRGRPGVVSDSGSDTTHQYNISRNSAYTATVNQKTHGLKTLGAWGTMATATKPATAIPYFVDQINPGTSNDNGNPRAKDGFVLISAGPDGIYGTTDDVCSFGAVVP